LHAFFSFRLTVQNLKHRPHPDPAPHLCRPASDEDDPTGDLATAHYIVKTAQERYGPPTLSHTHEPKTENNTYSLSEGKNCEEISGENSITVYSKRARKSLRYVNTKIQDIPKFEACSNLKTFISTFLHGTIGTFQRTETPKHTGPIRVVFLHLERICLPLL